LSAKEISHLDLSNTDLVVLSACQTALGDITNDGVAGLQRGFKIAGVKSVLMSLWKVDDAATYLLMKLFYKSLFAGKNKQQALRDAQNYLRSYMVGNERPYNDIHYWGAFILLDAIEN
jgi:CHAT domain-containing protein